MLGLTRGSQQTIRKFKIRGGHPNGSYAHHRWAIAAATIGAAQTANTAPFFYENCAAAREAGAAPVYEDDPGYGPHLDRDRDGIGCEESASTYYRPRRYPADSQPTRLRTVIRTPVAGATLIAASTGLFISTPAVAADPITTTALVLKVVDGDTIDIPRRFPRATPRAAVGDRHTGNEEAGIHRRLLGSRGDGVREVDHGGATSCTRDRPDSRPDRPIWPHTGLPCWGGRLGLFGRGRSRRHGTLVRLWGPPYEPLRREAAPREKPETWFADCGVRRAMATQNQYRCELPLLIAFSGLSWCWRASPMDIRAAQAIEGPLLRLDETPVFSRARVTALGTLDTSANDGTLLGATVIPWTHLRVCADIFAEVDVRGVLVSTAELHWLSADAEVEIIERPRYADLPENVVPQARPMPTPFGVNGGVMPGLRPFDTADGWPPLIWASEQLYKAVRGWMDPQISVEIILCALAVAPDDGDLRSMLLAGLKARHARLLRDDMNRPARYPWHRQGGPDIDGILSL